MDYRNLSVIRPNTKAKNTTNYWYWLGGLVLLLILFVSLSGVAINKPAIFSRVASLQLDIMKENPDGSLAAGEAFAISDSIKAIIGYSGATQGTKISLVFAKLVTDGNVRNGRSIIAQPKVDLTSGEGTKKYSFPAYEAKPGTYEVTLQSEGDVILKKTITLK